MIPIQHLRCPATGQPLRIAGHELVTTDGTRRYPVTTTGIPHFADDLISDAGRVQQQHYDRIASAYLANLQYPHTQEYMAYLDAIFLGLVREPLGTFAEICCGAGEGFELLKGKYCQGIGIDVSSVMLEAARRAHPGSSVFFAQGDATMLPIADAAVDAVVMLGGIHHVNDRQRLFAEIVRILKPGGRFLWREPVDDFFLWRALRAVLYRVSPTLHAETEHPIRKQPTISGLCAAGLNVTTWVTAGFAGYCMLMNSDVLTLVRAWRFLPGIRRFTRFMCRVDAATLALPGMADAGLQAMGVALKPTTTG